MYRHRLSACYIATRGDRPSRQRLEEERKNEARQRTGRELDRINPLVTGPRSHHNMLYQFHSFNRSSAFPTHVEGARQFARPIGEEARTARGLNRLKGLFNASGLPNETQELILASLTPQNVAKVGTNGLQARALSEPYSRNANIWKAALNLPKLSPDCIRQLGAIYKAPSGMLKSPEARRIEIFNILTKCIVPFERGTGTHRNDIPGFLSFYRMLNKNNTHHALLAKLSVSVNRVGMFYQDMRAVKDLSRLYLLKAPRTPKYSEVQKIVKRKYNEPVFLPVRT